MHKISLVLTLGSGLLLSSCSTTTTNGNNTTQNGNNATATTDTTQLAPVETRKANTDYKPAFEGQTRVAGVKTTTPFEGVVLSSGLNKPWGIISLPDGRLLITEKEGAMRIASAKGELSAPITG